MQQGLYLRKISTRRADVYLHVPVAGEVHAYALLKFGRHVDRTVIGYDGADWEAGKAAANELLQRYA